MKKKILSLIAAMTFLMSHIPATVSAEGEPVFDGTTPLRIQAEACDGVPSGNIRPTSWHEGTYDGSAVGNTDLNFSVDAASAGLYKMSIQLENQFGDKTIVVLINGETIFNATASVGWGKLGAQIIDVELKKGVNTFTVKMANNVRYDYVELEASSVPVLNGSALRLEAEKYCNDATYIEKDSKWSGGEILKSKPVEASIYVAEPGVYKVDVRWGSKYSDARTVELKVGDNVLFSGDTGIRYTASVQSFAVELSAGLSSVKITSPVILDNFYIDYIEFSPVTNLVTLAKDATVKIEAEDYADVDPTISSTPYQVSGGSRIENGNIDVNVYAEEAGTYEIKAAWGSNEGNSFPVVMLGGVATDVKASLAYWKTAVTHGNVTLNKGINNIKIAAGKKLWVDYIKISPAPTLSAEKSLRLEAEDYTTANAISTRHFASGNAYVYNNNEMVSEFSVTDGGEYTMTLASGGMSGSAPNVAVLIDGQEVYNKWSGVKVSENAGQLEEGCVGLTQTKVTLSNGTHTIKIVPELHALVDYVEFSKPADYTAEAYSYYLTETNVDSTDLTTALTSTYLGAYSGEYDETMLNTAVKALDEDMSFVYWPFTTTAAANYYLKVTYASAEESAAVCMVDPQTLPTVTDKDYDTVLAGAKAVASTTWQKAYSNSADGFSAPYFTEKYFNVGALSAGDHNFAFMYNSADGTNKGVSIRKVELISADNMAEGLIMSEAQFAAEAVGDSDSASSAKLVSNISEANTYSSESTLADDKNATTVIKHIYNNSGDVADFAFIAAAYDSNGRLINCGMSRSFSLGEDGEADIKVKVNTDGASYIKTFAFDMETLASVFESELFGK